jgi:hypothetical protein
VEPLVIPTGQQPEGIAGASSIQNHFTKRFHKETVVLRSLKSERARVSIGKKLTLHDDLCVLRLEGINKESPFVKRRDD